MIFVREMLMDVVGARAQNNVLGLAPCPRTLTSPRKRIRLR